jgi:hypothetical protein
VQTRERAATLKAEAALLDLKIALMLAALRSFRARDAHGIGSLEHRAAQDETTQAREPFRDAVRAKARRSRTSG